jgi:hypothetical protein
LGRSSGTDLTNNGNSAQAGAVNTGGGGGGGQNNGPANGGIGYENQIYGVTRGGSDAADGGPGIVIIRY